MTCEERQELLELYTLGALEAGDREEIDQHLAEGCERCTRKLKEALALTRWCWRKRPKWPRRRG